MSNFMVFMGKELWVNVQVAIFLGTVDSKSSMVTSHFFSFKLILSHQILHRKRISKFSVLEICEKIDKMSPENIIFTLGLVTIATTLTKKYTIIIMFFCSEQKKSCSLSKSAYYNGFLCSLYL